MSFITILLGLAGLGVVVFFHELGHFAMARLTGVEVDEFSLGWGPRLVSKKIGLTKYSISVLPIGGYCRMKGEDSYRKAIEAGLDEFPKEAGSYFGATPLKRILISLGGPLMNVVLAFFIYLAIMVGGYEITSYENRIILASEWDGGSYPADAVGLQSGDRIVSIDGKEIETFAEIQESISISALRPMLLGVERNDQSLTLLVKPELDKDSGAGRVGIYPWVGLSVAYVNPDGPAALAGLHAGDTIVSVNGQSVSHTVELFSVLEDEKTERTEIGYSRFGKEALATLVLSWPENASADLGIGWETISKEIKAHGVLNALSMGFSETSKTITATYRGIASLFMGVDILKAISGPARITWMVGTVAKSGLSGKTTGGLSLAMNFLAALSIGLFAMNLLPIPLLDGGSIVLFIVELIRRKAAKVKTVLRYQTIGIFAVAALFLLSTIGDVLFFSGK
jgi:regulator of sigma E protease